MATPSEDQPRWMAQAAAIDWGQIEHAYGPATDVPELIRTVVLGAETDALQAFGELANNLNHQGSIYPATGPAVPVLIEVLRATRAGPRVRAGLLNLLAGVAGGAAEWVGQEQEPESTTAALPGEGWDSISFRDVFAAVWRGAELYARLLPDDPDADVRMQAAHVLGVLAGPGPALVPAGAPPGFGGVVEALIGQVWEERDMLALSSVAFALGRVIAFDPRVRGPLRELMEWPEADEAVRVASALGLVEADGDRHEELAAVNLLAGTMSRAPETDLLFQPRSGESNDHGRRSPWVWGKLRFRLAGALCAWSAGDGARMAWVFPALLAGVRAANGYTAETDIGPILAWLWPGREIRAKFGGDGRLERELPPPVTPETLTGLRRAMVEACYNNPRLWEPRIGNTDLAFMRVGLPASRAGLGALLGRP